MARRTKPLSAIRVSDVPLIVRREREALKQRLDSFADPLSIQVLAISNFADAGVLYQGEVTVESDNAGSVAVSVLDELRRQGIDVQDGDWLFFPTAAPSHRMLEVLPDEEGVRSL